MKHLIAMLLTMSLPLAAQAHGLIVRPTATADVVRVLVSYDDGTVAKGATVQILSAAGVELSRGTTGHDGVVELPRPADDGCKIAVDAGDGHARTVPVPKPGQVPVEPPSRIFRTLAGLSMIGVIALLLRRFWPRSKPQLLTIPNA